MNASRVITLLSRRIIIRGYGPSTFPLSARVFSTTPVRTFEDAFSGQKPKRTFKRLLGFGGLALGLGAGALLAYYNSPSYSSEQQKLRQVINLNSDGSEYLLSEAPPYFEPARRVQYPEDKSGLKITLYQYQTCPFCCKARAFLDYYGLSYDVIEVNSIMRKQIKWSSYKKVPIVVVETPDGKFYQLKDSSMIISTLMSFLIDKTKDLKEIVKCYPQVEYKDENGKLKLDILNKYSLMYNETRKKNPSKEDIVDERSWRQWIDDRFVHMISPNVYRSPRESLQAFTFFDRIGEWEALFSTWERYLIIYLGAFVMWIIGKRLKKRYELKDDVRESFYDEAKLFTNELDKRGTKFLGGDNPNLADLSLYGTLTSIQGCDAFQDLLYRNKRMKQWFKDAHWAVGSRQGNRLLLAN